MWKNYLTIAYRNLKRSKGYAATNIGGLAVGLATCLVILLFVCHEFSYDDFHANADRTYRVLLEDTKFDVLSPGTPESVAPNLRAAFPEVEQVTAFTPAAEGGKDILVSANGKTFYEDGFIRADSNFFRVFSIEPIHGNLQEALSQPGSVVLTESAARKYFGDANPVGELLTTRDEQRAVDYMLAKKTIEETTYTVTAVVENVPSNSHLDFNFVAFWQHDRSSKWQRLDARSYVVLSKGANPAALESKLPGFVKRHVGERGG